MDVKKIDDPYLTNNGLARFRSDNKYVGAGTKSVEEMLGCTITESEGQVILSLPEGGALETVDPLYREIVRGKSIQVELLTRLSNASPDDMVAFIQIGVEFEKNENLLRANVEHAKSKIRTIKLEQAKAKWKERVVKGGKALAVGVIAGGIVYALGETAGAWGEHASQSAVKESANIMNAVATEVTRIKTTADTVPELQNAVTELYNTLGDAGKHLMEAAQAKTLAFADTALEQGTKLVGSIADKTRELQAAQYIAEHQDALIQNARAIAQQESTSTIASGEHTKEVLTIVENFLLKWGTIGVTIAASLYSYKEQFRNATKK